MAMITVPGESQETPAPQLQQTPAVDPAAPLAPAALKPTAEDAFGPPPAEAVFGPPPVATPRLYGRAGPPEALLRRLQQGNAIDRIINATGAGIREGFGPSPIGLSPEQEGELQRLGIFNDPNGPVAMPLRTINEAIARPAAALADVIMRSVAAGVGGLSKAFGQVTQEVTGSATQGGAAEREAYNLSNFLMLWTGGGVPVLKPTMTPRGILHDAQVTARIPEPVDFANVSKVTVGDATAEAALVRAYRERGVLPAEAFHDMRSDVTIFQDLAAGHPPRAYGNPRAMPERIVAPAIKLDDRVFAGPTHADALKAAEEARAPLRVSDDGATVVRSEGYLTSDGRFVDTATAAEIARSVKQEVRVAVDSALPEFTPLRDTGRFDDYRTIPGEVKRMPELEVPLLDEVDTMLTKFRGGEKIDRDELADLMTRLGEAAIANPDSPLSEAFVLAQQLRDAPDALTAQALAPAVRNAAEIARKNLIEAVAVPEPKPAEGAGGGQPPGGGGKPPAPAETPQPPSGGKQVPAVVENAPKMSAAEARAKVLERIDIGNHDKTRPWSFKRFYTAMVDDLHPVNAAVHKAMRSVGLKKLPTVENPYKLFRLTRGTFGKADEFLQSGTFSFKTFGTTGESLEAILKPMRKDLNGLRAYISSRRAVELQGKGKETGFDMEAARRVIETGRDKFEETHRKLVSYQDRLSRYLRDAGVLSDSAYRAMLDANKEYVPFYRMMDPDLSVASFGRNRGAGKTLSSRNPIKRITGSELLVADPIESIIKNTYAYIALAEKNAAGVQLVDLLKKGAGEYSWLTEGIAPKPKPGAAAAKADAPKAIEGGKPAEIEQSNAQRMFDKGDDLKEGEIEGAPIRAQRDTSTALDADFIELLDEIGIKDRDLSIVIHRAAMKTEGENLRVFRDGKPELWTVDDVDLLGAWRALDQQTVSLIVKMLAAPARSLRAGATLVPEFMARNILRDLQTAFYNSKGLFTPINTVKGFVGVVRKDADFHNWMRGGGANSAMVSLDRRYLQGNLTKLNSESGIMRRVWNFVGSPLHLLRITSELLENSTRLGEFKKIAGGASGNRAKILEGAFASREVTLDFARVGTQFRAINMISAFANAQVQGLDRLARAFKDRPFNTSMKIFAGVTVPSILLWSYNQSDPRWKEIPQWQKDLFWIVFTKDNVYRIPKPLDVGLIFGTGAERIMEKYFAENPRALDGYMKSLVGMITPQVIPTAVAPVIEQYSNRSLFTGDLLVPFRLEKQLPEYQYTPYTTELAKSLGRIFGAFPGMRETALDERSAFHGVATALTSPALLENYVRDWTGGLGVYAMQIADAALKKVGVFPDKPKPLSTLADIPLVRAFVVRYPSSNAQSLQDFYDRNEQNRQVVDTVRAQAKAGDAEAMQRVIDTYGNRVTLDGIQETLGQQSQLIRMITDHPTMKPEEKRQLIDTIYFGMIELARGGNKTLDAIEQKLPQQ